MKTSVIRYRVADFLRESAPFDGMAVDDVLGFAGTGKVLFHETDVNLFVKGDSREDLIWVIQQGRIEMLDETPSELELKDVLGPGDILGLRSHTADKFYRRTARTASEVILYAFDTGSFEALVSSYPDALRFLKAHLSASTDHTRSLQAPASKTRALSEAEKPHWLNAKHLADECQQRVIQGLRTCDPSASLRDVEKTLREAQKDRIVIVTPERKTPIGYATAGSLYESVASGTASIDSPVEAIMKKDFQTVSLSDDPGLCFLTMLECRNDVLIVTNDGSKDSPAQGCLTAGDIELSCGKNPITIQKALVDSKSTSELAYVWSRAQAFLRENWVGPSVVDWFGKAMSGLRDVLLERVIDISTMEMGRAGKQSPDTRHAWILSGESGRREFFKSRIDIGIVWADSVAAGTGSPEHNLKYFSVLAQKVTAKLEACGFQEANCHAKTLDDWKDFFRKRIQDPIGNKIYVSREWFDLAFLRGDSSLSTELRESIATELHGSESFIPVLANDTLAKLPPLTFFQGIAIEADGKMNYTLDLENTVLQPIIDASRVLVLLAGGASTSNTIERLGFLRSAYRQYDTTLADGSDAWRIACYHHIKQRFASTPNNRSIQSTHLSRLDQRTLKTAFDSTRSFVRLACLLSDVSPLR